MDPTNPNPEQTPETVPAPMPVVPEPTQLPSNFSSAQQPQPIAPMQPSTVIQVGSADAAKIPDAVYQSPQVVAASKKRLIIMTAFVILLMVIAIAGVSMLTEKSNDNAISSTGSQANNNETAQQPTNPAAEALAAQQAKAKDAKRKADIHAMHSKVEAYFADMGVYPTLTNLNDPAFWSTHIRGLDKGDFQDPDNAGNSKIAAAPAKGVYSYRVTNAAGASCDNISAECLKYELTATMSDGTRYSKQEIN